MQLSDFMVKKNDVAFLGELLLTYLEIRHSRTNNGSHITVFTGQGTVSRKSR